MIKNKTTKVCKACGRVFKPFKTTDKYCSFSCMKSEKEKSDSKPKGRTKINRVSPKRANELKQYALLKAEMFKEVEDGVVSPFCPLALHYKELLAVKEVHHIAGREGELLNEKSNCILLSSKYHWLLHNNADVEKVATELGLKISKSKR